MYFLRFCAFLFVLNGIKGSYIFPEGVDEKALTQNVTEFLRPYTSHIRNWFWELSGKGYGRVVEHTGPGTMADYITCEICVPAIPLVRLLLAFNITEEGIIGVITAACEILNLAPKPEICEPTIRSYATPILYILTHRPEMPGSDFCGIINPGCVEISDYLKDWTVNVNQIKPPVTRPDLPPANAELTKILQFTDVHVDLDYVEGYSANCGLPVCCRETNGIPTDPALRAGKYGHFGCESPEAGLKALYKHARETHPDTQFIFLTGDYIHSGVWLYSEEENTRHITRVCTLLKEEFPEDVEIYPLVGNHEPGVVNMFPPEETWNEPGFSLTWMYDAVATPFNNSIPPDQLDLFRKYGYYAVTPRNHPTLRIIVLNTNLCYIQNFWLPFDAIDTNGQLQWFAETLDIAENDGQNVLVLGHIHPGSGSCWPVWSHQFNRIIQRYEGIIKGQFYGHRHEQDYQLAFEAGSETPVSVSFVAGSGVTDGMNPSYTVYYADGERGDDSTWQIINHESWILNLTHSNAGAVPVFQKILDAKADFGVNSLAPLEVYDFIHRMICDQNLFWKYQDVVVKGHDSPRLRRCAVNDGRCKADVLSWLLVSNSNDHSHQRRFHDYVLNFDCEAPPTTTGSTSTGVSGVPSSTEGNGSSLLKVPSIFALSLMAVIIEWIQKYYE